MRSWIRGRGCDGGKINWLELSRTGPKSGNVGGSFSACETRIIQKVATAAIAAIGEESVSSRGEVIKKIKNKKKRLNRAGNERKESRILELGDKCDACNRVE